MLSFGVDPSWWRSEKRKEQGITMTRDKVADSMIAEAARMGREAGENAAHWYVQEAWGGRATRNERETARRVLAGILDGDPAVLDSLPAPDLSGKWAGDMTGPDLVAEVFPGDAERHERLFAWLNEHCFTEICDAYDEAFNTACQHTLEGSARAFLAG